MASGTAQRFLFGDELGPSGRAAAEKTDAAARERELRESEAFARGVAEGHRLAMADAESRRTTALERVAEMMPMIVRRADATAGQAETDALAFFEILALQVAGDALQSQPLAPIRDAAREAFRHLRGVPHLVARVHESLVEQVDQLLRSLARERGFDGRIIVLGVDDIPPGDARLEWAEGGVAADRHALAAVVRATLAAARSLESAPHNPSEGKDLTS